MSKICITTILIGNPSYKEQAKINHKQYCDRHKYDYFCLEEAINDFPPTWMRADVLLYLLKKKYDYVFWMDGDSFFINNSISLDKFINLGKDFVTTGDENDVVNAGHLLFRNSPWTISFIEKWLLFRVPLPDDIADKFKQVTTHIFKHRGQLTLFDQSPINKLLGGADPNKMDDWFDIFNTVNFYEGNKFRKHGKEYSPVCDENLPRTMSLICDEHKDHVEIVSQNQMNSYPNTVKKGDFILHFVCYKDRINDILPLYMIN